MNIESARKTIDDTNERSKSNPRIAAVRAAFDAGKQAYKNRDAAARAIPPYDMDTQPELWQAFVWGVHKEHLERQRDEARGIVLFLAEGL